MLFEHQDSLKPKSLLVYAAELRLDLRKFLADMESNAVQERILSDVEGAVRSGVTGTPTFFINEFRYDGDWSYDSLLAALTKQPVR